MTNSNKKYFHIYIAYTSMFPAPEIFHKYDMESFHIKLEYIAYYL